MFEELSRKFPLPWHKQTDSPFDIILDKNNNEVCIIASSGYTTGGPPGVIDWIISEANRKLEVTTTKPTINETKPTIITSPIPPVKDNK